jgi:hypothetical protein
MNLQKWLDGFLLSIFDILEEGQFINGEALFNKLEGLANNIKPDEYSLLNITDKRYLMQKSLQRLAKKRYIWGAKRYKKKEWYAKRLKGEKGPPCLIPKISMFLSPPAVYLRLI